MRCWNPDHLQLTTHAANQRHLHKTHCKHGHPLSGENLRIDPRTKARVCRSCVRESQRQFRAAAKRSHPNDQGPPGRPGRPKGGSGRMTELERLLDRTVLGRTHPELGTCWLFSGPANPYGRLDKGTERSTHRLGWTWLRGPIPDGMELHHLCGVHACWNPDHVVVVTHAVNMAFRANPHCRRGHPLSGVNLRIDPRTGARICRACNAASEPIANAKLPRGDMPYRASPISFVM
jgi:hypothetical protein